MQIYRGEFITSNFAEENIQNMNCQRYIQEFKAFAQLFVFHALGEVYTFLSRVKNIFSILSAQRFFYPYIISENKNP